VRFQFIAAEKARYPVQVLCRCLMVSRSGFYAWQRRGLSPRVLMDARLTVQLRLAHADSGRTYGRPRLVRALRARGIAVSGKRVARLMRAAGLHARGRRRFRVTTDSAHRYPVAPNRLRRCFTVAAMNAVWAADMTACVTRDGWCYLAVVLDLASRRVVGWTVRRAPTHELVTTALRDALARRRPRPPLLHHSDRGIQYASRSYQELLARHRITASMSRIGNCWDNAPVESFFSTFKAEAVPDRPWLDSDEAVGAIAKYIDFYNRRRQHSSLDYQSPIDFETRLKTAAV
jgi:putative transposase